MWYDYPIHLIFGILVPRTTQSTMLKAKHLDNKVLKCKYVLKQYPIFMKFYNFKFSLDLYFFVYFTYSVLTLVCPTVSELRFYGCCHPCYFRQATILFCYQCFCYFSLLKIQFALTYREYGFPNSQMSVKYDRTIYQFNSKARVTIR